MNFLGGRWEKYIKLYKLGDTELKYAGQYHNTYIMPRKITFASLAQARTYKVPDPSPETML